MVSLFKIDLDALSTLASSLGELEAPGRWADHELDEEFGRELRFFFEDETEEGMSAGISAVELADWWSHRRASTLRVPYTTEGVKAARELTEARNCNNTPIG